MAPKHKKFQLPPSEKLQVKQLLADMPKSVVPDSVWFAVSMAWIYKWQTFVGFESDPQPDHPPGPMDNTDIIHEYYRDGKN